MNNLTNPKGSTASETGVLFINRFDSRCGNCGRGAIPDQITHDKCYGYGDKPPGCGVRFEYVSSDYMGMQAFCEKRRPDLTWVGWDMEPAPAAAPTAPKEAG